MWTKKRLTRSRETNEYVNQMNYGQVDRQPNENVCESQCDNFEFIKFI